MKRQIITEVITSLFILLFAYTAINKIIALDTLMFVLRDYPIIGRMPKLVAWGLPITEIAVSVFLFIPRTKLIGLYSALLLMLGFTLYLIYMLIFTPNLPCTCGGMLTKLSWPQHLLFNIFFIFLGISGIWIYKKQLTQKQEPKPAPIVLT